MLVNNSGTNWAEPIEESVAHCPSLYSFPVGTEKPSLAAARYRRSVTASVALTLHGPCGHSGALVACRYSLDGWDKVYALNVRSVFHLTQQMLPLLEASVTACGRPARVINISSIDSISVPALDTFAYSSGKAAVTHMTKVRAMPCWWHRSCSAAALARPWRGACDDGQTACNGRWGLCRLQIRVGAGS